MGPAPLLRAPILVVALESQYELSRGVLNIGRTTTADIVLNDPLVSRMHARIAILEDGLVIVDDLHSTNGVYVNGVRLGRHSQPLRDGDRLLIGTFELSVFAARFREASTLPPPPTPLPLPDPRGSDGTPSTDRADALHMVGRLAERLNATGNSGEAVRVLSGHLNRVLLGASAGLQVPSSVLDDACHYAIELFAWTYNAAWIDYLIELHLSAHELPSEPTLSALESALANPNAARFDAGLLRYFVESFEPRRGALSLDETARLARLTHLARR